MAFDDDRPLRRPKRLDSLDTLRLRLRLTKSGRSVTRQAQRMASAGSTDDLWKLRRQFSFFDSKSDQ